MLGQLVSLIVAPIIVGLAIEPFSYWLDEKNKDDDR